MWHTKDAEIIYLVNKDSKHRDLTRLLKDFLYFPSSNDYFEPHIIPKGFVTDNASVPDFLAQIVHPNDKRLREGAWFHDYIWRNKDEFFDLYGYTDNELRKFSNKEMKSKCIQAGLSKWKANAIFLALQYSPAAKKIWRKGGIINDGIKK